MAKGSVTVHSSVLFDPKRKEFVENVSIEVDRARGAIRRVYVRRSDDDIGRDDIDLRGGVVMPGFVDSHTHVFLHPYSERSSTEQMRDESLVERTVRATLHVRDALLSGYTTCRDLGTEAAQNADANLRDCINRGLIPGPRLFVATHAVASTGSYAVRSESRQSGHVLPPASDADDGPFGVRRAVRRRVADGADVVKFYADYRRKVMRFPPPPLGPPVQFPPADPNPQVPLFAQEEMDAIVAEAALSELPVAAHAGSARAALMAARAGVTSIEHCQDSTDEVFAEMRRRGTIFVPTLGVLATQAGPEVLARAQARAKRAHDMGVRLAAGGDTGTFPHGEGVLELELLREAGIPLEDVLEACTVGGWEACGKDLCGFRFGWFEEGNRADIIALDADPREDPGALRRVGFVMKDGRVWKRDGRPVGMLEAHRWSDAEAPAEAPAEAGGEAGEDVSWTAV